MVALVVARVQQVPAALVGRPAKGVSADQLAVAELTARQRPASPVMEGRAALVMTTPLPVVMGAMVAPVATAARLVTAVMGALAGSVLQVRLVRTPPRRGFPAATGSSAGWAALVGRAVAQGRPGVTVGRAAEAVSAVMAGVAETELMGHRVRTAGKPAGMAVPAVPARPGDAVVPAVMAGRPSRASQELMVPAVQEVRVALPEVRARAATVLTG
jgi:hypothetical protein